MSEPKVFSAEWFDRAYARTPEERMELAAKNIHDPEGIVAVISIVDDILKLNSLALNTRLVALLIGCLMKTESSPYNIFRILAQDAILGPQIAILDAAMVPVEGERGN